MSAYKVPVQSLIDHIKTAVDVDPWAKEMAEELLIREIPVKPTRTDIVGGKIYYCGQCGAILPRKAKYCCFCGFRTEMKWR